MVCIQCGAETQVFNSRHQKRSNQVWRRRKCLKCQAVFSTTESADYGALWAVIGKNGRLTPFSRDRLFLSLYNSLQHRHSAIKDANGLTTTVISKLTPLASNASLPSSVILSTVQLTLNRFDNVASVHYHAFHKN
jgi:transcriptional repressor NrdR